MHWVLRILRLFGPFYNLTLVNLYEDLLADAQALADRPVQLAIKALGVDHPDTASAMLMEARALRRLRRKGDAVALEKSAAAILMQSARANLTEHTVDVRYSPGTRAADSVVS